MCMEMSRRQLMGTFKLSETSPLPFVFLEQMATGFDRGERRRREKVNDVSQVRKVLKTLPRSVIGCLLRKLKVTHDDRSTSALSADARSVHYFWGLASRDL